MTRRALLFAAVTAALRADSADEVWDAIGLVASALSEGNAAACLSAFDSAMPGYERLRTGVTALLRDNDVETSIDLVSNEGDGRARTVESDWQMRLTPHGEVTTPVQRRERVVAKLEKQGKRWRIVGFEPAGVLDPPGAR
ncbi:MAG TPA: hypothetical protein VE959_22080 [Bryobacteraceae bacterium]|nr:hypothetical protein [Bryobacteraceae bacterium]